MSGDIRSAFITLALSLPAIVLCLSIHETAHGGAAYLLGDRTARDSGRVTLSPMAHIDPIGFLCLLLFGFGWQLGSLPQGYDHKYTYSHIGYNLKITDMQAACGLAQLDRLDGFIAARKRNFEHLSAALADTRDFLVLPEATPGSDPAWFGYPITLRPEAGAYIANLAAAANMFNLTLHDRLGES